MTTTFDDFVKCVNIQGHLDFEALKFIFLDPLKDLNKWWQALAANTKAYIDSFTAGAFGVFAATALKKFLTKILETIAPGAAAEFSEYLSAVVVGIGFGTLFDVLLRCGLPNVTNPLPPGQGA